MPSLSELLRRQISPSIPKPVRASLAARLGYTDVAVEGQATPPSRHVRPSVGKSSDLDRILALPVRKESTLLDFSFLQKANEACQCSEMRRPCAKALLPIQAQALTEAATLNGMVGAIGVGHGKELICELLPLVMRDCKTAILLISPDMRESLRLDWDYYGQHWHQPNLVGGSVFVKGRPRLKVIAYSELSHEKFTAALQQWKPDLIIANEAHSICGLGSVRTRRVLSYCAEHPECRFIPLSGTLTTRSLKDYGHLCSLALGEGSPLPNDQATLEDWAQAIDPPKDGGKLPALMGSLVKFCRPGESIRAAFKRRRAATPGMIDTSESAIPNALNVHLRTLNVPEKVQKVLTSVRRTATRPDGEEFTEAWQISKCLKEIAAGFYYRWIYPRGELPELIDQWFKARQAWNREVRELLQYPKLHLDSPKLAARAAIRAALGQTGTPERPVWHSQTFEAWRAIRKQVEPEVEGVWIDDWLAQDAAQWSRSNNGIIWYSNRVLGIRIAELAGVPRYGGGAEASVLILREKGYRSIVASMKAHHKNKNLQMFSRNLVTQQPPDAAMWEQLLGRTHRRGQLADTVEVELYLHTPELRTAFEKAEELARYVGETTPNPQKLSYAAYSFAR